MLFRCSGIHVAFSYRIFLGLFSHEDKTQNILQIVFAIDSFFYVFQPYAFI